MKSFGVIFLSLALAGVDTVAATYYSSKCYADNCARAVTGTHRGPVFTSQAKADCSSYVVTTSYGHTATVTAASVPTEDPKTVPTYASLCSGSARYTSACSCYGITSHVTVTVTVTPSSIYTGPGYQPTLPASYASCDFDPVGGGEFELLTPNALAIVNDNGKAVEASDPEALIPGFVFSQPAGAPAGVYDIVNTGSSPLYFAVFKSGEVGFVSASTNGQSYVADPTTGTREYVTTIWSVECGGLATAGIIGSVEFQFTVRDNGEIAVTSAFSAARRLRKARDIHVPKGFYVKPKEVVTPPGSKCPSPVQHAVTKSPPVPQSSNGCGPADWRGWFVPNLEFESACNFHDICWGVCSETMASCNTEFLSRMLAICAAEHDPGSRMLAACNNLAHFYHSKVSGPAGAEVYTRAQQQYCHCACNDPALTACADQCVDATTDPDNCGSCGFTCPSRGCTNGACAFNSCTGQTCSTFGPCGPGGSCVCASVTGGSGFCVDGDTPCAGLPACGTSADCPLGSVCAVGTCCGSPVCIVTDQCGGFSTNGPRWIFDAKRDWAGPTVGHPAVYVDDGGE
ncbi:hypothetical protein N658DRAFT_469086 [Parathielavia hyrcaniae]|uniref:Uncharacterized protein n=1 Tax=Parathielavia hyrcaniae TaxID=113614 RepID=A0AAN6Q661_9PEZI|nr:hypothetical protein N658DRAFT_469086 [Parathielavia hyrcaniae]